MKIRRVTLAYLALATLAFVAASHVQATEMPSHPALAEQRPVPAIDPSTFIVGHPASPRNALRHANETHPGIAAARSAGAAHIDANTYLVQPPASVTWREGPDPKRIGHIG